MNSCAAISWFVAPSAARREICASCGVRSLHGKGGWPGFTYLDQDDRRHEIDRDGYVTVGDIGHVDEDGLLHLTDRARDMVISGGTNVYPIEIGACLLDPREDTGKIFKRRIRQRYWEHAGRNI